MRQRRTRRAKRVRSSSRSCTPAAATAAASAPSGGAARPSCADASSASYSPNSASIAGPRRPTSLRASSIFEQPQDVSVAVHALLLVLPPRQLVPDSLTVLQAARLSRDPCSAARPSRTSHGLRRAPVRCFYPGSLRARRSKQPMVAPRGAPLEVGAPDLIAQHAQQHLYVVAPGRGVPLQLVDQLCGAQRGRHRNRWPALAAGLQARGRCMFCAVTRGVAWRLYWWTAQSTHLYTNWP